jgi:hypothetical protein
MISYCKVIFILIGLHFCCAFGSPRVIERQLGLYKVEIAQSDNREKLVIEKDGRVVFSHKEVGSHFYFGNRFDFKVKNDVYSGHNITGNNIPNLVISKWTGGSHCCHVLYIFEIGTKFRKIAAIRAGAYPIRLVDYQKRGIYAIEFWDNPIDGIFASSAFSPPGRVVVEFVNGNYQIAERLMFTGLLSRKNLKVRKAKIRYLLADSDSPDLPYELLETMMNLSYSGHIQLAMETVAEIWPADRPGLKKFKDEFRSALEKSSYWVKLKDSVL